MEVYYKITYKNDYFGRKILLFFTNSLYIRTHFTGLKLCGVSLDYKRISVYSSINILSNGVFLIPLSVNNVKNILCKYGSLL